MTAVTVASPVAMPIVEKSVGAQVVHLADAVRQPHQRVVRRVLPVVAIAVGVGQPVQLRPGDLVGVAGDQRRRRRGQHGPPAGLRRQLGGVRDVLVDRVLLAGHEHVPVGQQQKAALPRVARRARRLSWPGPIACWRRGSIVADRDRAGEECLVADRRVREVISTWPFGSTTHGAVERRLEARWGQLALPASAGRSGPGGPAARGRSASRPEV